MSEDFRSRHWRAPEQLATGVNRHRILSREIATMFRAQGKRDRGFMSDLEIAHTQRPWWRNIAGTLAGFWDVLLGRDDRYVGLSRQRAARPVESVRPGDGLLSPEQSSELWRRISAARAQAIAEGSWYGASDADDGLDRVVEQFKLEQATAPGEAKTPAHIHIWEQPEIDWNSRAAISFGLTGFVCKCGATRENLGPAYGYRIIEAQPQSTVEESTPEQAPAPGEAETK